MILGLSFTVSHFGYIDLGTDQVAEASLKSKVTSNNTKQVESTVDKAGSGVIKLARDIGVVVLVVMLVWAGYSLFVKKSAEGLADMKGRLGVMILAIAFIFFSEQIIGAILSIFGVKLT